MNKFIFAIFILFLGMTAHAQSYQNAVKAFEAGRTQTAVRELIILVKAEDANAQFYLGDIYRTGKGGIRRDVREAGRLFRLAAEQGHADAQYNLARMYSIGNGVPESPFHSYVWFSIAKTNNYTQAQQDIDRMSERLSAERILDAKILAVQCYSSNYRICD